MRDAIDRLFDDVRPDGDWVLVTVIAIEGSAPREVGASMIVTHDGATGTIGGGRLEHQMVAEARALLGSDQGPAARSVRVALGPGLGQCCGGAVTVWLQRMPASARGPVWLGALREALRARQSCTLATVVGGDLAPAGIRLVIGTDTVTGDEVASGVGERIAALARQRATDGACEAVGPSLVRVGEAVVLLEPQPGDRGAIYVFGAGHVGRALVPILANVPGTVVWIDPRAGVFPALVPPGVDVRASDAPEDEVDGAPPAACFVVLTHDHGLDLRIVEAVLRRGAFGYLGLIGSTTKRARFERRLEGRGIAAAALARLRCPIGVEGITGRHPGEIAVAIAAEILQRRRGEPGVPPGGPSR